ncbi:MAG: proline--tRNA ligase [Lachnospiraceae bacterium]|nr:proline--tRNA ligase [Lachnospiraceae bacterium]
MKMKNLVGERFKERPSDCVVDSHAFMVRGGYIKQVANGIFSLYTPARRVTQKIEQIIREEMDNVDCQEVLFPVVLPGALWKESGRYDSVDSTLARFNDRNDIPMVLGMTHEEASVQLVRDWASSYQKYPFSIYQIQTKFRDEARPRAGLIRVREFTMKDAYSFHTSQEDLEQYYDRMYRAYERVYARAGLPEVIAVKSDSGMMGGSVSHEYMLLTDIGEDSIVICKECDYRANMEAADCVTRNEAGEAAPLTKVYTPDTKTIEELVGYLKISPRQMAKAVVYQKNADDAVVVAMIRGDLEINETKLRNYVGEPIHPAVLTEDSPVVAGFIGPVGISKDVTVIFDASLKGIENLATGANEANYHYTGMNISRDIGEVTYVDVAKAVEGGICPCCGKESLIVRRGVEVGNIFQLGTKYSKAMNMTYVDAEGKDQFPIMGCYGIGVGRLAASCVEERHDDWGPIWPITIAPWQVQLCCLRADDDVCRGISDQLYADMQAKGIEVMYDDRDIRPGAMFSDADLLGCPIRVIVSPKNLKDDLVEIVTRDKSVQVKVPVAETMNKVREIMDMLYAQIEDRVPEIL